MELYKIVHYNGCYCCVLCWNMSLFTLLQYFNVDRFSMVRSEASKIGMMVELVSD